MNALQPYPAYKDSGAEWLGEVPEHWRVRRVATVADLAVSNVDKHVREGESPVRLCNYLDVYHNERIGAHLPFMAGTATEREIRKFRLAVGDVLITKDSEDWSDIGVPALVDYAAQDLVCGYHLAMLRPDGASLAGGYLFQALKDSHVAWQCQVAAAGVTRYGLSRNAIRSMRIPLPPLPEQTAIARFLDDADRRIRRYIRAKERLIELLEEERRATIHEAVTGRIDVRTGQPYPAYKDSGVEWLGQVPEHWEVRRVKHAVRTSSKGIQIGPFGSSLTQLRGEDTGYKLYGQEHTISGDFRRGSRWITQDQFRQLRHYELLPDDVVLTRKGSLGKCRLVPRGLQRGIMDSDTIRVRLDPTIVDQEFMVILLHRATYLRSQIEGVRRGAVLGGLNTSTIANLATVLPPMGEQKEIKAKIGRFLDHIGSKTDAVARQIALLREYRTRLIADVVTGKLDVREAAADLPETAPLADDRARPDAIPAEPNPHSTERDMMKEAIP